MASRVSTRITPAWRNIASTAACGTVVRCTVWPIGTPWVNRPDRTATTGLVCANRRATRLNLRGLPIDSRNSSTTSVAASSPQYCIRSLPDTSARLPADTNVDRPSPRRATVSRITEPSSPDWQKKPTAPRAGTTGDRDAFRHRSGAVLMMPSALGPITRRPYALASRASLR